MAQEMVAGALVSILIEKLIEYAKSAVICHKVCKALQEELELIRPDVKRIEQQMVRRMQSANAEPLDVVERWLARLKEKLREAEKEVNTCNSGSKIRRLNAFENSHLTRKIQSLTEDIRKLAGDDVSRAVLSSSIANGSSHGGGRGGSGRGRSGQLRRGRGPGLGRGGPPGLGRGGSGHLGRGGSGLGRGGSSHGSSSSEGSYHQSSESSVHGPSHQDSMDLDRWRRDFASIRQAEEETRSSITRRQSIDFTQQQPVELVPVYQYEYQPPAAPQYHIPHIPHIPHCPSGYYW